MNAEDNAAAWRAVIMHAEGTSKNTNPYNVMFGGGTFDNTKPGHPDTVVDGGRYASAAAGAYQFMPFTWAGLTKKLGLPPDAPMTKENQDKAATYLANSRGVDIRTAPFTRENVAKLAPEWASFPTLSGSSYYGQPVKAYGTLKAIFNKYKPSSFVQQASDHLTKKYGVKPEPIVTPTITKTKPKHPLSILGFK